MASASGSIGRRVARSLGWVLLVFSALTGWGYFALGGGKGGEAFVMGALALGLPSFLMGCVTLWLTRRRRADDAPSD